MADIKAWLEKYSLEKYHDVFASNAIELDVLATLTENDLVELGLNLGDRKRMMRAIEALRSDQGGVSHSENALTSSQTGPHAPQPTALEGVPERRYLTLVFVDLVGSTELSSHLDLEEYRSVLHDYQALCFDVVTRHQGHIAQFIGDGVVAYFGYPTVEENDAERAVAAGLEICGSIGRIKHGKGEVIGVLDLARPNAGPFTQRQIDLVESFADQAVIAINNARLFGEVKERTAEVEEALEYQTATS